MGNVVMEATQINYRRDETLKTVDQKLQELSETSAIDTDIAPVFKSNITYHPGDLVYYRNKLYVFTAEHTGAWAAGDVTATDVSTAMNTALAGKADYADIAGAFSEETAYAAGDLVIYNGIIYRCTNDHTGEWDSDDFSATTIGAELNAINSNLTNVADDVKLNTQDLTTPSRTKNLLPMTLNGIKSANTDGTWSGNAYTISGVTFTILTDNDNNVIGIETDGTSTNDWVILVLNADFALPAGTYAGNGVSGGNSSTYRIDVSCFSTSIINGDNLTTISDTTSIYAQIVVRTSGTDVSGKTFYPMIRLATETDSTFAPHIPSVESRIEAVEAIVASYTLTPATSVTLDRGSCIRTINTVTIDAIVTFTANKGKNNSIVSGMPAIGNNNIPMIAVAYSNGTSTVRHVRLYNDAIMASEDFASGDTIHIMGTYTII